MHFVLVTAWFILYCWTI